jgi:hypothetical protein
MNVTIDEAGYQKLTLCQMVLPKVALDRVLEILVVAFIADTYNLNSILIDCVPVGN